MKWWGCLFLGGVSFSGCGVVCVYVCVFCVGVGVPMWVWVSSSVLGDHELVHEGSGREGDREKRGTEHVRRKR